MKINRHWTVAIIGVFALLSWTSVLMVVEARPVLRSDNILRNWRLEAERRLEGSRSSGTTEGIPVVNDDQTQIVSPPAQHAEAPIDVVVNDSNPPHRRPRRRIIVLNDSTSDESEEDQNGHHQQGGAIVKIEPHEQEGEIVGAPTFHWPPRYLPQRPRTKMRTVSVVGSPPNVSSRGRVQIPAGGPMRLENGDLDTDEEEEQGEGQQGDWRGSGHGSGGQQISSPRPLAARSSSSSQRERRKVRPIYSIVKEKEQQQQQGSRVSGEVQVGPARYEHEYNVGASSEKDTEDPYEDEEEEEGEEEEGEEEVDDDSSFELEQKRRDSRKKNAIASTAQSSRRRRRPATHHEEEEEKEADDYRCYYNSDGEEETRPSKIFLKAFHEKGLNLKLDPTILAERICELEAGHLNKVSIGAQAARYIQREAGQEYYSRYSHHMTQMHSRLYEVMKIMRKREPKMGERDLRRLANEEMLREIKQNREMNEEEEKEAEEGNDWRGKERQRNNQRAVGGTGNGKNNGRPRPASIAQAGALLEMALAREGLYLTNASGEQLAEVVIDMPPGRPRESLQAFRRRIGFYITDHGGVEKATRIVYTRELRRLVRKRRREWENAQKGSQ